MPRIGLLTVRERGTFSQEASNLASVTSAVFV